MRFDTVVLAIADPSLRAQVSQLLTAAFERAPTIVETEVETLAPRFQHDAVIITCTVPRVHAHHVIVLVNDHESYRNALRLGATEVIEVGTLDKANLRRAIESTCDRSAEVDRVRAELRILHARVEEGVRLRRLADALPVYISYVDTEQRYQFLNRKCAAEFGRPPEELLGITVAEAVGPSNYPTMQPRLEAALAGEEVQFEQAVRLPTGEVRYLDVAIVPDQRANGAIVGCFAHAIDITDRKWAESLTQRVLDNLFCHVWILELDGTVLASNGGPPKAELVVQDLRGRKFWDATWWAYSTAVQDQLRAACARAELGETVRFDVETRLDEHGPRTILDLQLAPLRDPNGRVSHLVPSAVDVTHRVRTEQALRESERRLRLAQDAGQLAVYDFDLRSKILLCDERVCDVWGFMPHEPTTVRMAVAGIDPKERKSVLAKITQTLDPTGDGRFTVEYRVINRVSQSTRWVCCTGQASFESGVAIRLVGTVVDITERKEAEAALCRSEEQLRESDRRKDEFLGMLGHELRNPLAAIQSASDLLGLLTHDDFRLEQVHGVLGRQCKHMVRLIDGLLEITRITRGKIHLEWGHVDLCAVLSGVIEDRREQLTASGLLLSMHLVCESLRIVGDEVRLVQVFDNLISNAVKFTTAPGEIRVTASREHRTAVIARPPVSQMRNACVAAQCLPDPQASATNLDRTPWAVARI